MNLIWMKTNRRILEWREPKVLPVKLIMIFSRFPSPSPSTSASPSPVGEIGGDFQDTDLPLSSLSLPTDCREPSLLGNQRLWWWQLWWWWRWKWQWQWCWQWCWAQPPRSHPQWCIFENKTIFRILSKLVSCNLVNINISMIVMILNGSYQENVRSRFCVSNSWVVSKNLSRWWWMI